MVARKLSEQPADRVDVLLKPRFAEGPDFVFFREAKSQQPVYIASLLLTDPLATRPPNF